MALTGVMNKVRSFITTSKQWILEIGLIIKASKQWILAIGLIPIFFALQFWTKALIFSPELTFGDLLVWSEDVARSSEQLQKSHDWTIDQWSGLGAAVLTATLGFISAAIIEALKGTPPLVGSASVATPMVSGGPVRIQFDARIILGIATSLAWYGFCQYQISLLNIRFVSLYSLLNLIALGKG